MTKLHNTATKAENQQCLEWTDNLPRDSITGRVKQKESINYIDKYRMGYQRPEKHI
ncbi:hypothetical protein GCM10025791_08200 [Halioxenophilus aromaticivorans]|uniref:Uncharacterized protein n=1 Tax=Halioxenophilus aromaticivorans TaxID=1306992 RepID=A0AAV3TZU7_9ALTE